MIGGRSPSDGAADGADLALTAVSARAALPTGPPLHLERPGAALAHLRAFVHPRRVARMREVLARRTRRLTALLEHVHDPHNVAACVRTCDAFGVQDLHVVPQPGAEAVFAGRDVSRGAQRWLTITVHPSTSAALAALRTAGYRVAATDLGGAAPPRPLSALRWDRPAASGAARLCIAFGNEHDGISETLRAGCDERVQIPMHGFVESLNISVAFAVAIAQLRAGLDASRDALGDLSEAEEIAVLDRWIVDDVPRARAVLHELAARGGARAGDR